jgi:hypothetical protein
MRQWMRVFLKLSFFLDLGMFLVISRFEGEIQRRMMMMRTGIVLLDCHGVSFCSRLHCSGRERLVSFLKGSINFPGIHHRLANKSG